MLKYDSYLKEKYSCSCLNYELDESLLSQYYFYLKKMYKLQFFQTYTFGGHFLNNKNEQTEPITSSKIADSICC